jgi:hypothetical protein
MFINNLILSQLNGDKEKIELINNKIIECKKEYRKWLKERHDLYYDYYGKPIGIITASHWEYDSGWMKVFIKDQHWSEEEKLKFIEDNWIHCRYSAYDCTGQIFTWAIDVFNIPSGVVAYIRNAMDV